MPVILQADETKVIQQGDGWQEIGLADKDAFGAPAMVVRRWVLRPGAQGPELIRGESEIRRSWNKLK